MNDHASQNEGIRILDEFVCEAIPIDETAACVQRPDGTASPERLRTENCTAEQCGILMRNAWRYAHVADKHVLIHSPSSDISVAPPGVVRYVATIEILGSEFAPWGHAEPEAVAAVVAVFGLS